MFPGAPQRTPHACNLCTRGHDACCIDAFTCNEAKRRADEQTMRRQNREVMAPASMEAPNVPPTAEVFR